MMVATTFLLFVSVFAVGSCEDFCTCYGYLFSGFARYQGFQNSYANPKGCGQEGRSYCNKICRKEYWFRSFDAVPGRFGDVSLGDRLCREARTVRKGKYQLFSQACDQTPTYAGIDGHDFLCCAVNWTRC